MALTGSQLLAAVADRVQLSKADAKRLLDALEAVVLDELANAQKVGSAGLCNSSCVSSPQPRSAWVETPRPASRSRSLPSPPASTFARGRSRAPSRRCRRCKGAPPARRLTSHPRSVQPVDGGQNVRGRTLADSRQDAFLAASRQLL